MNENLVKAGWQNSVQSIETTDEQRMLINKYDAFINHEIPFDDYSWFMYGYMENYIKDIIRKTHRLSSAEFEDCMQAGAVAIISKCADYDPRRCKPTTYFAPFIYEETRKILANEGTTKYYVSKATVLNKIAREYGFSGMADPNLTADTLAILSGQSLETVLNTMEMNNRSVCSLDAIIEKNEIESDAFASPETKLIEKERAELINAAFSSLNEFEQFLIREIHINGKSYRKVLTELKQDEGLQEDFKDYLPTKLDEAHLKQIENKGLLKLAGQSSMRCYFDFEKKERNTFYEQVSAEDIAENLGNIF